MWVEEPVEIIQEANIAGAMLSKRQNLESRG
jgi:hypothetical protein